MTKREQLLEALIDLEIQRRQLAERAATLREQLGLAGATPQRKRHLSAAGRARIAAAQRKRWAAKKAPAAPKPARKKVVWTPAMRKKAAERMRRLNKEMAKKRAATKTAA